MSKTSRVAGGVRSRYFAKRILSCLTFPLFARLSTYGSRSFLWSRHRESVPSAKTSCAAFDVLVHLYERRYILAYTPTHEYTHKRRHTYIRDTWYVSARAYVCEHISWNTKSSNPLLETRLIPHIEICLWRALLPCYWLGVISCKLGCLAAGAARTLGSFHTRAPGLSLIRPPVHGVSLIIPVAHTIDTADAWRTVGACPAWRSVPGISDFSISMSEGTYLRFQDVRGLNRGRLVGNANQFSVR